jgi:two-component system chemotaxis response regulator CheY
MAAIVARILKVAGFGDVDRVHDGARALDMLRQKHYDLVITDWIMEPINGPMLLKLIRADARVSKVRTILITTLQNKDDEAWLDGADGYLTKPFVPADLIAKVDDVLSSSVPAVSSLEGV